MGLWYFNALMIILTLFLVGSSWLAALPQGSGQQEVSDAALAQQAAHTANTTRDWLNGKLSTPGTSAELREVSRTNQSGQLALRYNVFVKGVPKDQTYTLFSWPINAPSPSEQMKGLSIANDGLVVCAGRMPVQCVGDKEDDPVGFTLSPARGEVVRMALVSANGKTKLFFATIPDPIIQKNKTCSLEVVRLTPQFELVLVRARGYQPNEDLLFASKSYDESHEQRVKADTDGGYATALLPFAKGKQNGRMVLSLKSNSCTSELSFDWGK
jgi:hypothetical protein